MLYKFVKCAFAFFVWCIGCQMHVRSQELEQIRRIYDQRLGELRAVYVKSVSKELESLIAPEVLWAEYGIFNWGREVEEVARSNEGRIYFRETNDFSAFAKVLSKEGPLEELTFSKLLQVVEQSRVGLRSLPRTLIFDGEKIVEQDDRFADLKTGKEPRIYSIVKPERLSGARFFPSTILDYWFIGWAPDSIKSQEIFRLKDHAPAVLAEAKVDRARSANGHVVLRTKNERITLAPELAFTMVKREVFRGEQLIFAIEGSDFKNLVGNVYLPNQFLLTNYGYSGELIGKPIWSRQFEVVSLAANSSETDRLFQISIPPASSVVDERFVPTDVTGTPQAPSNAGAISSVTYTQPADLSKLDEVIEKAKLEEGERLARWHALQKLGNRNWGAITFCVAAVALLIAIVVRRYRLANS